MTAYKQHINVASVGTAGRCREPDAISSALLILWCTDHISAVALQKWANVATLEGINRLRKAEAARLGTFDKHRCAQGLGEVVVERGAFPNAWLCKVVVLGRAQEHSARGRGDADCDST